MIKKQKAIVAQYDGGLIDAAHAAMVLRCIGGDAKVFPRKTETLVDFLECEGKRFREIYIVGIPFAEKDAERAETVLKKLKCSGVMVEWEANCCHRNRGVVSRRLHDNDLLKFMTESGDDIGFSAGLKKRFGIDVSDLDGEADLVVAGKYCVTNSSLLELVEAVLWAYNSYGWEDVYSTAIHVLSRRSACDSWPEALTNVVAHYRRFKRRELLGRSRVMEMVREKVRRIAQNPDARVMIVGETGTGKETVAMQIHYGSARWRGKFISFNCATVNADLMESRFFGHEAGSFTDAKRQTKGLFEEANGGTLFLDEIGELGLEVQGLLLRALEEGCIMRVGGTTEIPVNVRLITATHRDLTKMVREGRFRADLFQRLSVVQIRVPPLREHKEDIPEIVSSWVALRQKPNSAYMEPPTETQIAALMEYDYPGNVRELLNLLERADILGETDFAKLVREQRELNGELMPTAEAKSKSELVPRLAQCNVPSVTGIEGIVTLEEAMRKYVRSAWEACGKNATLTAKCLGTSRNTVRKYLNE